MLPCGPAGLAEWANGRLRRPRPRLEPARTGLGRAPHRRWCASPWAPIDVLDDPIDTRRTEMTGGLPHGGDHVRRRIESRGDHVPRAPRPLTAASVIFKGTLQQVPSSMSIATLLQ